MKHFVAPRARMRTSRVFTSDASKYSSKLGTTTDEGRTWGGGDTPRREVGASEMELLNGGGYDISQIHSSRDLSGYLRAKTVHLEIKGK